MIYSYVMHMPRDTAHTPLLSFNQHFRPVSNIPPYRTHQHRKHRYATILSVILHLYLKIQLFIYIYIYIYIGKLIFIAALFLILLHGAN